MSYNLNRRIDRNKKKQFVSTFKKENKISENQLVAMILKKSKALVKPLDVCLQTKYLICLETTFKQMKNFSKVKEDINGKETSTDQQ